MAVREREIEGYLRRRVEKVGGRCVKFIPDVDNGMPDRVVMLPGGVLLWVETKKPKGGKVSSLQREQHRRLRALGQRVEVVWTKEDADALLSELAPALPQEDA
jgi:protein involved in temperature-dependent protein secretion